MRKSILLALAVAGLAAAQINSIRVQVDATDAPRHLFHTHLTIPAKPGPLTLLYPEWIPGEHGPTGPIIDMVGLHIAASGRTLAWSRDPVNMYAFHLTVPSGVSALDVRFDQISPPETSGFSSGASTTAELAVLSWNQVVLYPQGIPANQLEYQGSLRIPDGWQFGTALPVDHVSGGEIDFKPAPLNTLIDSPVSTSAHYKTIDLGRDGSIPHFLHLAADSDRALDISDAQIREYKNLVNETGALFGSRHYRDYHFLLTMSDHIASFGLEHHESSDDRIRERGLIEESSQKVNADLLPHEFVHSWNGKYRRPAGLVDPDYSAPMKGNLLWVYEGLTQYLGEVLAARTGLLSADDFHESLAMIAAQLDSSSGRKWRPLEDTAVAAQLLYDARDDYASYRRGVDYYDEGTLIWLDADMTIRQLSKGKKSINDFCRSFYGGAGGAPALKPYTFDDLVAALNAIQPYDWAGFFKTRVYEVQPHAPLGGIESAGWKLDYTPDASGMFRAREEEKRVADFTYSIGIVVRNDGSVADVSMGGPAQLAGIAPEDRLITINNRQFKMTLLHEAVQATANSAQPIELMVKRGEYYKLHRIEYRGGEKYPRLQRDSSKPDTISKIIAPLTKAQ